MKSIFYRPTGKLILPGRELPKMDKYDCVRRNAAGQKEVFSPDYLNWVHPRTSIFVDREDPTQGADYRRNAIGDTASTATGYQIVIDTLTWICKEISEQKFYKFNMAELLPIRVGEGAWSSNLLTNLVYSTGDDFESGIIRLGTNQDRLATADTAIAGSSLTNNTWAKAIQYSLPDIETAIRANNWDIIQGKHLSRMENWQLGLQQQLFLGNSLDTRIQGLFNLTGITVNTTFITAFINSLGAAGMATFVGGLMPLYFAQTNSTALPNRFVIPYQDWLGLTQLTPGTVGTYPYPMIKYLEDAFKAAVGHMESDFKIIPNAYCDHTVNNTLRAINKNIYMLYRHDPKSVKAFIPVDYMTLQPNSLNNFQFQDVGVGQFTGVQVLRGAEMLQFQF